MTNVRNINFIIKGNFSPEKHFPDLLGKDIDSLLLSRRNRNNRTVFIHMCTNILRCCQRRQIGFVQKYDRASSVKQLHDLPVVLIQIRGGIYYIQNQICILHILPCLVDSNFFHNVIRITNPCGVYNIEYDSIQVNLLFKYISCSTGDFCNDRPLFAQ